MLCPNVVSERCVFRFVLCIPEVFIVAEPKKPFSFADVRCVVLAKRALNLIDCVPCRALTFHPCFTSVTGFIP